MKTIIFALLLMLLVLNVKCAKILGIFNYPSQSHHILAESLLKTLAIKGHEVTMLSPFSTNSPPKNYEQIVVNNLVQARDGISKTILGLGNVSSLRKAVQFLKYISLVEDTFLNHTKVQTLIRSKKKFDLAIIMWFGNDAILALADHLAEHTIIFSTLGSHYHITKLAKSSAPPAYVPNIFPPLPDEMTLMDRLINSFTSVVYVIGDFIYGYKHRSVIDKYFPNAPSTDKLYEHVSLILLNTHYSLESPRPYVPQMIQVGGLHLEKAEELPEGLKKIMDNANEGVILFSLGSNIKSSDLNKRTIQNILECFRKLPYIVLWKFETDSILDLPENVKIRKWLPQKDLLAHKNMKLFITHGGLSSTIEAIYYGVPMIGIPIFGDQEGNINEGVVKGYVVRVSFADLSEVTLSNAITEVMNNPRYRNNIELRSRLFRDQPIKPMEKAVYWVEYVLRHDGAHHLKTAAFKLHWLQEWLVDVFVIVSITMFMGLYVVCKLLKYLHNKCSKKTVKSQYKEFKTE